MGCLTDRLRTFVPNMRNDNCLPSQPKGVYRVKNWPEYNAGLIQRGNVSIWMDEAMFAAAPENSGRRGRPQSYCDGVIQMLLILKSVYRLPLRALQGFAMSLQCLALPALPVPNYSTLSRRAKALRVTLPVLRNAGEAVHLLVDSTGLKLFGEGEWKVRKHGYAKRRSWRKVHFGMDAGTGQVCAVLMTHKDVDDASVVPELLVQIPQETKIEVVIGDGAYATQGHPCGHCRVRRAGSHSSRGGRSALACQPGRSTTAQRGHRAYCAKRQAGLQRQKRLSAPLPGGESDVPPQDADGRQALGAQCGCAGRRSRCSGGHHQPHAGAGTPEIRPDCLKRGVKGKLYPRSRFMQQRPVRPLQWS